MKTIIILMLLCITSAFSQKLWEIQVNPDDLLRDVKEIPNSDLLLFTYNTGKLEIRRSGYGSFVNQLIKKPHESGELRITNNGQLYYYQSGNDTLEYRDILTNETVIRISPEIEGLEGDPKFDSKAFQRFELFENNTKVVGNMVYMDDDDSRNNVNYFVIYDIPTRTVEYKNNPYDERYMFIGKSYLSPDDRYFIETAYNKPYGRIFNLETKEYEFEFDGSESDEESYKIGAISGGKFESNNLLGIYDLYEIKLFTFPDLILYKQYNFFNDNLRLAGYIICN